MAIIPCPAQGINSSTSNSCDIFSFKLNASIPALDKIMASYSPLSNFLILVSTFPLINL